MWALLLAEREGFEPSEPFGSQLFESCTLNRSDISPMRVTDEERRETGVRLLLLVYYNMNPRSVNRQLQKFVRSVTVK